MKNNKLLSFVFTIIFFVFVVLFKGWIAFSYWPFAAGIIIGALLPQSDKLIYKKFLTSESQEPIMIFHTYLFQLIFLVLTFWIISSSGSLLGRGIVLSFSFTILMDEWYARKRGETESWKKNFPIFLTQEQEKIIFYITALLLVLFAFLF